MSVSFETLGGGRFCPLFAARYRTAPVDIYTLLRIFATMNIKTKALAEKADDAAELLKALANRHRLLIICQLIESERSVGELAEFLGIRDSTVSQHLALLRKDGLVTARRDGQTIWYSIGSAPACTLLEALYGIYCTPSGVEPSDEEPNN
jgi:DNA-binding transcriptional ArsR family regulator